MKTVKYLTEESNGIQIILNINIEGSLEGNTQNTKNVAIIKTNIFWKVLHSNIGFAKFALGFPVVQW